MLGSHNTLSYLPTVGLKSKLLKPWAECQEIDFMRQYYRGVRCFDVRIRFDKGKPMIVHNGVTYKGGEKVLNELFHFMNTQQDCYLRLGLDIRKKPKDADEQTKLFEDYIQYIQRDYPYITLADAIIFWSWEHVIKPTVQVTEKHASVDSTWELIKTPKNYAKKYNKEIREQYANVLKDKVLQVLLIDFINY